MNYFIGGLVGAGIVLLIVGYIVVNFMFKLWDR